jgi:hypothetical protein
LAAIPFVDIPRTSVNYFLTAYLSTYHTLAMHPKPLLALMTMCRKPGNYVGQRLETDVKFYMGTVAKAVERYINPSEGEGNESKPMDKFVQRGKCQSIAWDAAHCGP